jgi:hypothetical protein
MNFTTERNSREENDQCGHDVRENLERDLQEIDWRSSMKRAFVIVYQHEGSSRADYEGAPHNCNVSTRGIA